MQHPALIDLDIAGSGEALRRVHGAVFNGNLSQPTPGKCCRRDDPRVRASFLLIAVHKKHAIPYHTIPYYVLHACFYTVISPLPCRVFVVVRYTIASYYTTVLIHDLIY